MIGCAHVKRALIGSLLLGAGVARGRWWVRTLYYVACEMRRCRGYFPTTTPPGLPRAPQRRRISPAVHVVHPRAGSAHTGHSTHDRETRHRSTASARLVAKATRRLTPRAAHRDVQSPRSASTGSTGARDRLDSARPRQPQRLDSRAAVDGASTARATAPRQPGLNSNPPLQIPERASNLKMATNRSRSGFARAAARGARARVGARADAPIQSLMLTRCGHAGLLVTAW